MKTGLGRSSRMAETCFFAGLSACLTGLIGSGGRFTQASRRTTGEVASEFHGACHISGRRLAVLSDARDNHFL